VEHCGTHHGENFPVVSIAEERCDRMCVESLLCKEPDVKGRREI